MSDTVLPTRPDRDVEEWRRLLATLVRDVSLPVDRVRSPQTPLHRDAVMLALPPTVAESVRACADTLGCAELDVLAASWLTLVVRLSGQSELTAGLPLDASTTGTETETEPRTRSFIAPVPLMLDNSAPFRDVVRTVADARRALDDTLDRPFTALRSELGADDDPYFRVAVTTQANDAECDGAELVLVVAENASFEYTPVYERDTVEDIAGQWVRSLAELVADPTLAADTPDLVDAQTRKQERAWGSGWFAPVPSWTVPTRFAEQAGAHPDRVAVRCEERVLTYAELADRSFRLAQVLRDLGARPGTRVAVCLNRSTDMLAALVGVMASGAAYVPVDPAYPAERVEYMLTDADVVAVVTSSNLMAQLPSTGAHVIAIDASDDVLAAVEPADPATPADLAAGLADTAYVIYTSGSTGKPKGVMVPHRGLTNFLDSVAHEPGLREGEALLAVTTLSFDIAGLELYLPLVVGGTVVIATHDECRDPSALAHLLVEHDVTQMQATPATWRLLIEWGWEGKDDLVVLCGGEALPPTLAEALVPKCAALWNMYGPTETTIWSTLCQNPSW